MTGSQPASPPDPHGRNLTHAMLHSLGRAIVTGAYDQTAFPNEATLAQQYQVSRTITREAVKMLAAKGLLHSYPRIGTRLRPEAAWNLYDPDVLNWLLARRFSLSLLRHFTELRAAVEPGAAALAAQRPDPAAHAAIAQGYARMQAAQSGHDDPLDADIAFHVAILHATGNPFFLQLQDLVTTALRVSIRFTNRLQGRTANLAEHEAVLTAIHNHAPTTAANAMHTLITNVLALMGG